jgi:acyl transferase domain-containing protein/acyl carrier protein
LKHEPIAIVGMSCRLPGGVSDPRGLWDLLIDERDAIGDIPPNRLDIERYLDPTPGAPGKINTNLGGYLDDVERFDAAFFGIAPPDAERMDPQHRIMLELAWEALEDAGADIRALEGSNTGVFVGSWTSDYENRLHANTDGVDLSMMLGAGRFAVSGRLSYSLDLRGPSFTVDSACSASLVGVHLAVRALREGQCPLALAGAVNLILNPHVAVAYNSGRILASDGRCKFGDAAADGFVRSEGAGIVVLKPLAAAQADGDRIHAVIRGSAIGNDGRSGRSMGTPGRAGQAAVLRAAYADAGVAPHAVGYLEAHGTGTRAGDRVELSALADVLGAGRPSSDPLLVGSIKTNIGHAEAAAGMAGLIKAALIVESGTIPRSLHFHTPNPRLPWAEMNLRIASHATPFPGGDARSRYAGINSFGIGGSNAHVVLEGPPSAERPNPGATPPGALLLPLSARSPEALRALAARYAERLDEADAGGPNVAAALCWAAAVRRTALTHRAAFAASDAAGLADDLRRFAAGDDAAAVATGVVRGGAAPRVAFVMPGHGGQFAGMGRELLAENAAFRAALEECDAAVRETEGWSLLAELENEAADLDRIDRRQPLLCALSIAYAAALRAAGVAPAAVAGHSMGEVAAAAVAGVLSVAQAMRLSCRRSALMRPALGKGAMATLDISLAETERRLAGRTGVVVAALNGPRTTVISGEPAAIAAIAEELQRENIFCRLVKLELAAHGPQMDGPAAALGAELSWLEPRPEAVPIYSTVDGGRRAGEDFDATYWSRNLRLPVRMHAAVSAMASDGLTCFIELGPHPVLLGSLQQTVPGGLILACGRRERPADLEFRSTLGALWVAGSTLAWRNVIPEAPWIDAPLYPWQRKRHWAEAAALRSGPAHSTSSLRLNEDQLAWLHHFEWKPAEPAEAGRAGNEPGRWLVVGASASASALADALEAPRTTLDELTGSLGGIDAIAVVVDDDESAPFVPLRVLQTLAGAGAGARVWFVTRGGQGVHAHERVSSDAAAVWGAARAVGAENPGRWGGLADIGTTGDEAALARHLRRGDGEDQVAFRDGRRFVLRLAPSAPSSGAYTWREDGAYLITAGLGDVALHVARRAARSGARRLILLGRTPLPPREQWADCPAGSPQAARVAAIRELEARGVSVHTAAVDVADEPALRAFLERYRAEGWPPIRGVLHAASASAGVLAGAMDAAAFEAVLAPKLRGARLLDRLLPNVEMFVLFSSMTAFLPHSGIAAYAAANAGLDGLAHDRRARGLPAVSLAWGFWEGTGLAAGDAGVAAMHEMERLGFPPLEPTAAAEVCAALCNDAQPYHAVFAADWTAFKRARAGRTEPLFDALLPAEALEGETLADRLAGIAPGERRALLNATVREALGGVLKLAPDRLDHEMALGDLGLSSLLAIELRNRLEAATGLRLPATLAWNYPTIAALAGFLGRELTAPLEPLALDPFASVTSPDIDALSDDDALRLLMAPSG